MCGALGPRRDPSSTFALQPQTGAVEETPPPSPPARSDLAIISIHFFIFPSPITAALLSGDRTNRCVRDGEAPTGGLVAEHDLRKSQQSDFGGADHLGASLSTRFLFIHTFFLVCIGCSGDLF